MKTYFHRPQLVFMRHITVVIVPQASLLIAWYKWDVALLKTSAVMRSIIIVHTTKVYECEGRKAPCQTRLMSLCRSDSLNRTAGILLLDDIPVFVMGCIPCSHLVVRNPDEPVCLGSVRKPLQELSDRVPSPFGQQDDSEEVCDSRDGQAIIRKVKNSARHPRPDLLQDHGKRNNTHNASPTIQYVA